MPGIIRLGTQILQESRINKFFRCGGVLKLEWEKNCLKSSVGQKVSIWESYSDKITFFWTHKPGFTPDPFPRHHGIQTQKIREKKRTAATMILILKWVSHWTSLHNSSQVFEMSYSIMKLFLTRFKRCCQDLNKDIGNRLLMLWWLWSTEKSKRFVLHIILSFAIRWLQFFVCFILC